MLSDSLSLLPAVAAAGIASHVFIFVREEWHVQAPTLFKVYALICCVLGVAEGLKCCLLIASCYAAALFSSMLVYRVFFHPLRNFPGPRLAGVTKFWHMYHCRDSKNHLLLNRLHCKYGPLVRTGPAEITVFLPEIMPAIDGPGNLCIKAVWYDMLLPEVALNTTRDKQMHDQRRRIWDRGFTVKALLKYEDRVVQFADQLERHIANLPTAGRDLNVSQWFYFFSFDVMGEFAFGKSFGMLRDEKWNQAVVMLRRGMGLLGPLSSVPWLAQIGFNILPRVGAIRDWRDMLDWCRDRMTERIKLDGETMNDVSHWLIEASKKNNTVDKDRPWLNGDSIAIIVAGSDTVAPTLVFIFYELVLHPSYEQQLYEEIKEANIHDRKVLQALPLLNGFINECLRLHPPVPTGGYRETPPNGLKVAGHFIPGHTTVVAPSCFEQAHKFVPERWYSKPEMVKDKRAFAPFSQGRYNCVGKALALAELRYVTALLVSKYKITFAPGEDGSCVISDLRDQFTAVPGNLWLRFEARKKAE